MPFVAKSTDRSDGFQDTADTVLDLDPGRVAMALLVASVGDGLAVFGQRLVGVHGQVLPVAGPCDDRNDAGLAGSLALQRDLHLLAALVGTDEVGAEQEQYEIGTLQVFVDFAFPLLARRDAAVAPGVQIAGDA